MRTIFSNGRHSFLQPVFVSVYDNWGRSLRYHKYATRYSQRQNDAGDEYRGRLLYRINVYPKRWHGPYIGDSQ